MEFVLFVLYFCGILCGISDGKYQYRTLFYEQKVDHFSYINNDTFKQRYLINLDSYELYGNRTIFVYAGNEGDIEMFAENTGFIWETAPLFHAAVVFIEHRYYGRSLPYDNLSFKNITYLGYLTSEQALADYAEIILFLKGYLPEAKKVPVIIFGGSYGGMLAAWMRIKYPHIVSGALASSAPILSFNEDSSCDSFEKIVTHDFLRDGGLESIKFIQKSWPIIRRISNETGGMERLIQNFHICENNSATANDLVVWLSDTWSYMAMTNYPYPTNFLNPLPAYPIKEACKYLKNYTAPDGEILFNLYQAASVFHNYSGNVKCFDLLESGGQSLGTTAWNFQVCTELVRPSCQTGVTDMFEPLEWNFTVYKETCFKKYGVTPEESKTFKMYGGKSLQSSSNIIFTNGLLDPWSSGGILKSISDSVVAIVMKDAAHHLDLRSANIEDPPSVVDARYHIIKYFSQFIIEDKIRALY